MKMIVKFFNYFFCAYHLTFLILVDLCGVLGCFSEQASSLELQYVKFLSVSCFNFFRFFVSINEYAFDKFALLILIWLYQTAMLRTVPGNNGLSSYFLGQWSISWVIFFLNFARKTALYN